MKALITGSAGLYGRHLCIELESNGYEVICCDLKAADKTISMDILDPDMVRDILSQQRPDVLINMAGQANVGLSWKSPQLTMELNTIGAINILEAVRCINPGMRVIVVGSSDEYGNLKERGSNVTEDLPICPMTPYAISKLSQELFARLYQKNYGMNICLVRQFNLGGAGQEKGFIIADFASGIAEVEAGKKAHILVGNLESARDFTHVKDACRAIRLIAEKGFSGEVYNICSGVTYTAQQILDKMIKMAKVEIKVQQDLTKMRPSDTPVVCGNHDKLTEHTGWFPEIGIDEIIRDALNFWREQ